jgi:hypothetical protein
MFVFNPQMMEQIGSVQFDQFERKCLDFLRDHFPELEVNKGSPQELEAVRSGIQMAGFRGFTEEADIAQYLYLRQLLGSGFDAGSNPVSQCLHDYNIPASERIERAMELIEKVLDTPSASKP